jgi:hypothetical protein
VMSAADCPSNYRAMNSMTLTRHTRVDSNGRQPALIAQSSGGTTIAFCQVSPTREVQTIERQRRGELL